MTTSAGDPRPDQGSSHRDKRRPFYYIPFGRYEGSRSAEFPANEVLIGREKQRAEFLKHLFAAGRRGAYLITGHRGSGKTSFVRHCLDEYDEDVFQRYLQRNVGRAFFWDRIGQTALLGMFLVLGLLLSELSAHLIEVAEPTILTWVAITVLGVALSYPFVAASRAFSTALYNPPEPGEMVVKSRGLVRQLVQRLASKPAPNLFGPALTIFTFLVILNFTPMQAPGTALAIFLIMVAVTFLVTQLSSLSRVGKEIGKERGTAQAPTSMKTGKELRDEWPIDDPSMCLEPVPGKHRWLFTWWFVLLSPVLLPIVPQPAAPALGDPFLLDLRHAATYTSWALVVFSIGLLIRWLCSRRLFRESRTSTAPHATPRAISSAARWNGGLAVLLQLLAALLEAVVPEVGTRLEATVPWVVGVGAVATLGSFLAILLIRPNNWPWNFRLHPRPAPLLMLKGIALILGGTQLAMPVLRFVADHAGALAPWLLPRPDGVDTLHLFQGPLNELVWLGSGLLLMVVFNGLEYEWIVRPFYKLRNDFSIQRIGHGSRPDQKLADHELKRPDRRERYRRMLRETFFYRIHRIWLPVLRVQVNLGFDLLDHRLVIEAMLTGLRNAYRRYFLHWRSPFAAMRKTIAMVALLILAVLLGHQLFGLRSPQQQAWLERREFCREFVDPGYRGQESSPSTGLWLACRMTGETGVQALNWAPFEDVLKVRGVANGVGVPEMEYVQHADQNLLTLAFRLNDPVPRDILDIRLHTLLLFGFLAFLLVRLTRRWGIPPYHRMDERMCEILDGLSRTLRYESRPQSSPLAVWMASFSGKEEIQHKEGGPFDPRTVELEFIELLEDLQDPAVQIPFGSRFRISPPIPEIVFVFDELDKVGLGLTPSTDPGPEMDATEPLDQERERSRALHKLFGDLKNTISSAKARFVFIGGRNLHDEWLADQTARRPLLTHIFDLELYVPSLLTDLDSRSSDSAPGVRAFLRRQAFRAQKVFVQSKHKRLRSLNSLWVEDLKPPTFVQLRYYEDRARDEAGKTQSTPIPYSRQTFSRVNRLKEWIADFLQKEPDDPWPPLKILESETCEKPLEHRQFEKDLVHFLAYRSKGNVKRLRELMESFIEPKEFRDLRVFFTSSWTSEAKDGGEKRADEERQQELARDHDCDHILAFGERDRYRIQLIADLYRQLGDALDVRIRLQDDKMPQAILYLSDFLLKFHRRAFAWSNIERVDELVHIHRAPDLRNAVEEIITGWNDRFLHRIRNGMYDFRCTSEFARELEYASRCSEQELAALNFTLDESQFLKAIYRSRIGILGDESGLDFIAGLAELHKFDEEYELARSYLRRAIAVLDQRYRKEMQQWGMENPVRDSLQASDEGLVALRTRLSWGTTRIRLMLQVGMTFERARNLEHAVLEYREARTLATSLIAALSGWLEEAPEARGEAKLGRFTRSLDWVLQDDPARGEFISTLKHLNILYQPMFAEAWGIEKLMTGVDTAPALVDAELWSLREMLPFVSSNRYAEDLDSKGPLDIQHSNFGLVMAELHNKAGDLFFFKGRQLVERDVAEEWCRAGTGDEGSARRELRKDADKAFTVPKEAPGEAAQRRGAEGYLIRATDHYCTALHDLRRYTVYRLRSSSNKFGMPTPEEKERWPTIERGGWSDFVRRVAAGTITDLSDSLLARFSYTGLLLDLNDHGVRGLKPAAEDETGLNPEQIAAKLGKEKQEEWESLRKRGLRDAHDLIVDWLEAGTQDGRVVLGRRGRRSSQEWKNCIEALTPSLHNPISSLDDWFATPRPKTEIPGRLLVQSTNNRDSERLISSLLLSIVAARMMARGGYYEAAAAQLIRTAAAVSHILWWRLSMEAVTKKVPFTGRDEFFDEFGIVSDTAKRKTAPFFSDLLLVGVLALWDSDDYIRHVRKDPSSTGSIPAAAHFAHPTSSGQEETSVALAPELITLACSLALAGEMNALPGKCISPREHHRLAMSALEKLIKKSAPPFLWQTGPPEDPQEPVEIDFHQVLCGHRKAQRYPMLDQLHCLKILLDHTAIQRLGEETGKLGDAEFLDHLERLREGAREYGSGLHFTPLELGSSLALARLGCEETLRNRFNPETIRIEALEQLVKSQQMYTLQAEFYRSIGGLYYLYDDFNDRSVHFHHAIQMAGTEFSSFLRRRLELLDDHKARA